MNGIHEVRGSIPLVSTKHLKPSHFNLDLLPLIDSVRFRPLFRRAFCF